MLSVAANFLTGAGVKIVAGAIWKMMQASRDARMASINAPTERIEKLQGGVDNADDWTRFTRRVIAFSFCGVFCFVIIWLMLHPTMEFKILVPKHPSFLFSWIFGSVDQTTMLVSAGSLLWDFKAMIEILVGFYFTKFGK
jgi:hypothetical protein